MIQYNRGGIHFLLKVFQLKGSVFPTSLCIALPCSFLTLGLKGLKNLGYFSLEGLHDILEDNAVWSGFTFLVGFLIVFRTSQAYARFWEGCTSMHQMHGMWFHACSATVSFSKHSKANAHAVHEFEHMLVRLFSMLHAVALAEIEDTSSSDLSEVMAFRYELLDIEALDSESLQAVKESDSKVELVFQWIQQLIVEQIDTGVLSIPAPILSRVFQEIAEGMLRFHEAIKISTIPFPFPYAQTCDFLLILHWLVTPWVTAQWVNNPGWALVFSFISVFILWSLNCIAVEIENPFGSDDNDLDACTLQDEMNKHLVMLLSPEAKRLPTLGHVDDHFRWSGNRQSLIHVWNKLSDEGIYAPAPVVRSSRASSCSRPDSYRGSITSSAGITSSSMPWLWRVNGSQEVSGCAPPVDLEKGFDQRSTKPKTSLSDMGIASSALSSPCDLLAEGSCLSGGSADGHSNAVLSTNDAFVQNPLVDHNGAVHDCLTPEEIRIMTSSHKKELNSVHVDSHSLAREFDGPARPPTKPGLCPNLLTNSGANQKGPHDLEAHHVPQQEPSSDIKRGSSPKPWSPARPRRPPPNG